MAVDADLVQQIMAARAALAAQERVATQHDGEFFFRVFLPHYMQQPFAQFHRDFIKMLFKEPPFDLEWRGKDGLVTAAPRGHAKSTLASLLKPLKSGCHKEKKFVVIVSNTDTQAADHADNLRKEFETNPHILDAFGNLRGDRFKFNPYRWAQQDFTVVHTDPPGAVDLAKCKVTWTTRYVARGMLSKIRGLRTREARPDLLILDDAENDEHIKTPEQRTKTWNYLNKALLPMLDPVTGEFVCVGTILHYDSMLAKLLKAERAVNEDDE